VGQKQQLDKKKYDSMEATELAELRGKKK